MLYDGLYIKAVLFYLLAVNGITFCLFTLDKWLSKQNARRIRERDLLLAALVGGSIGGLIGMYVFRHKTRHNKFKFGIPLIIILQAGLIMYWLS